MYFEILDVFTDKSLAGNQLAVFYPEQALGKDKMQAIAREMNFSETTFVLGGSAVDGYDVRIFTPADELPFAGHPTLGTSASIARRESLQGGLTLNLGVGPVAVTVEKTEPGKPSIWWLKGPTATFGEQGKAEVFCDITALAESHIDLAFPIEQVCVGPTFTILPCVDLAALDQMQLDLAMHAKHFGSDHLVEIYGVSPEPRTEGHDLSVRLLFDAGGVREDPATGSAAVCLGAWLLNNNYLGKNSFTIRVEQGGHIERPSTILVKAHYENNIPVVHVGGSVVKVAEGQFDLA